MFIPCAIKKRSIFPQIKIVKEAVSQKRKSIDFGKYVWYNNFARRFSMKLIERKQYLDKMIGVIGIPDIKVLTGVRRSGKSKLLEAFKAYVQKNISDANIIQYFFVI